MSRCRVVQSKASLVESSYLVIKKWFTGQSFSIDTSLITKCAACELEGEIFFFERLTSNKRVNRNLLNNASLLQLSKIKKHGCCQHEKALERKNNHPQTHFHFKLVNFTRRWKWLGTLLPKLGFRGGGGNTRPAACIKRLKEKRPGSWVWEIHSCCLAWRDTVEVLWLVYLRANSVQLWKKHTCNRHRRGSSS